MLFVTFCKGFLRFYKVSCSCVCFGCVKKIDRCEGTTCYFCMQFVFVVFLRGLSLDLLVWIPGLHWILSIWIASLLLLYSSFFILRNVKILRVVSLSSSLLTRFLQPDLKIFNFIFLLRVDFLKALFGRRPQRLVHSLTIILFVIISFYKWVYILYCIGNGVYFFYLKNVLMLSRLNY